MTLPPAKSVCQAKLCWEEIDTLALAAENSRMKQDPSELEPKLYIGEWIKALNLQPRAIAKVAGVSEPYLSQLIRRTKDNPTYKVLFKIATAIGVGVKDLQSPPPSRSVIEEIRKLSRDQLERLTREPPPN